MASVLKNAAGQVRIQFTGADRKRMTIYLGQCPERQAETIRVHVESLIASQFTGSLDPATAKWLAGAGDKLTNKLASLGLAARRESVQLGEFVDGYIAGRTKSKPRTSLVLKQAGKSLVDFFGEKKPLRDITPGDADDWRAWMLEEKPRGAGNSESTARRRCGVAKQFAKAAIRKRLI